MQKVIMQTGRSIKVNKPTSKPQALGDKSQLCIEIFHLHVFITHPSIRVHGYEELIDQNEKEKTVHKLEKKQLLNLCLRFMFTPMFFYGNKKNI